MIFRRVIAFQRRRRLHIGIFCSPRFRGSAECRIQTHTDFGGNVAARASPPLSSPVSTDKSAGKVAGGSGDFAADGFKVACFKLRGGNAGADCSDQYAARIEDAAGDAQKEIAVEGGDGDFRFADFIEEGVEGGAFRPTSPTTCWSKPKNCSARRTTSAIWSIPECVRPRWSPMEDIFNHAALSLRYRTRRDPFLQRRSTLLTLYRGLVNRIKADGELPGLEHAGTDTEYRHHAQEFLSDAALVCVVTGDKRLAGIVRHAAVLHDETIPLLPQRRSAGRQLRRIAAIRQLLLSRIDADARNDAPRRSDTG